MQSFNIHIFKEPVRDLCICHVQSANGDGKDDSDDGFVIEIPSFLKVTRKLEDNQIDRDQFGTFNISLINKI
jgi:hypothetical protein